MQYMDQSHAIKGLPPQLKLQLLLAINMRQLARVPIFKHCDTRVILMIVQRMQREIDALFCSALGMGGMPSRAKARQSEQNSTADLHVVVVTCHHDVSWLQPLCAGRSAHQKSSLRIGSHLGIPRTP